MLNCLVLYPWSKSIWNDRTLQLLHLMLMANLPLLAQSHAFSYLDLWIVSPIDEAEYILSQLFIRYDEVGANVDEHLWIINWMWGFHSKEEYQIRVIDARIFNQRNLGYADFIISESWTFNGRIGRELWISFEVCPFRQPIFWLYTICFDIIQLVILCFEF